MHSAKMGGALKILERMVNQNAEDEIFQDFKYWEVSRSVGLSVGLSVYISVGRFFCLSFYLLVCLSVYMSVGWSVYISICLSVCRSVRQACRGRSRIEQPLIMTPLRLPLPQDASDQFREGEGSLLPLWRFSTDRTKRKQVHAERLSPLDFFCRPPPLRPARGLVYPKE